MRALTAHLSDIRRAIRWATALAGVIASLAIGLIAAVALTGEQIVRATDTTAALWLAAVIVSGLGLMIAINHARQRILERAALWIDYTMARDLLDESLAAVSPAARRNADDMASALDRLRQAFDGNAMSAATAAPWLPLSAIAIAVLDQRSGLFAALLLTVTAVLLSMAGSVRAKGAARADLANAAAVEQIASTRSGEVRALGLEAGMLHAWSSARGLAIAVAYDRQQSEGRWRLTAQLLCGLALLAPAALVIDGVRDAEIDRIRALATMAAVAWMVHAVYEILCALPRLKPARLAWRQLAAVAAAPSRPANAATAAAGVLRFTDVSLIYRGRRDPALDGVGLAIHPADAIAITGSSGSGKSTLAALAAGAVAPSMGQVDAGGLRIGYLPETSWLMTGTVAENIARFAAIDRSLVHAAVNRAGVAGIIAALPLALDTPVVVAPGKPFGGLTLREARAVAFARALLTPIDILVLDAPDLAMSPRDVQAITAALGRLRASGVGLVICCNDARFHSVADRIAVLDHGALMSVYLIDHRPSGPALRPNVSIVGAGMRAAAH